MIKRIKGHRHLKPGIFPDRGWHVERFHFLAHLHQCGSSFFFIRVNLIPDFHNKLFLVCRKICLCGLNIYCHAADPLLQNSYLLRVTL